jgi:hypothetical protein
MPPLETVRPVAGAPLAVPSVGCEGCDQGFVSGHPSGARLVVAPAEVGEFVPGGGCSCTSPESRTLGGEDADPRLIVAPELDGFSLQPVAQLSGALVEGGFAGVLGWDGSFSTLCSGCVLVDATLGVVGAARPVEVIELLKPIAAGRDSGRSNGGAATESPMLDQPPSTGVIVTGAGRGVVTDVVGVVPVGVVGHAGADVPLAGVLVHGDETPPRVELLVVVGAVVEVNGFDDGEAVILLKPCSAALIPASTPSRTAVPVSLNALCVRCVIDGALGGAGWP